MGLKTGLNNIKSSGELLDRSKINFKQENSLPDVLAENDISYEFSYKQIGEIVKEHFKNQGRTIDIKFRNEIDNDRFGSSVLTYITIIEESEILGVKAPSKREITLGQLESILASALELEGKKLVSLINNATASTNIEGYGQGEHAVKSVEGKTFTITIKGDKGK